MKNIIAFLFFINLSIQCFGQFVAEVTVNTTTLNNKSLNLNILDNRGISLIANHVLTFKNGRAMLKVQLPQRSNMASLSFVEKGKTPSFIFVIDSGQNKFDLDLINNRFNLSNLSTKGYNLRKRTIAIFDDKLKKYREDSGKSDANVLPSELNTAFFLDVLKEVEREPNNYFSLITLYQASKTQTTAKFATSVLETLATLHNDLQFSPLGKQILKENTQKISSIKSAKTGNKVTTFNVNDINGKPFSNNSLEGQNYIIAFSATWCVPCQHQLPKLQKVYNDYRAKGLKVIYFNDDDDISKWKDHIKKNNLDWINVSERLKPGKAPIQKSFGVYAIPSYFIIDKNGTIIYNSDETDNELTLFEQKVKELYLSEK